MCVSVSMLYAIPTSQGNYKKQMIYIKAMNNRIVIIINNYNNEFVLNILNSEENSCGD